MSYQLKISDLILELDQSVPVRWDKHDGISRDAATLCLIQTFEKAGLKLRPSLCDRLRMEADFLGLWQLSGPITRICSVTADDRFLIDSCFTFGKSHSQSWFWTSMHSGINLINGLEDVNQGNASKRIRSEVLLKRGMMVKSRGKTIYLSYK